MKTPLYIAALLIMVMSCKKKQPNADISPRGVWVESTLRADTLDFEVPVLSTGNSGFRMVDFRSSPYRDTIINPFYPVNHSSLYQYYFNGLGNEMALRSTYSSSTAFNSYPFTMQENQLQFTIEKFYNRRDLPGVIAFVRIK